MAKGAEEEDDIVGFLEEKKLVADFAPGSLPSFLVFFGDEPEVKLAAVRGTVFDEMMGDLVLAGAQRQSCLYPAPTEEEHNSRQTGRKE